MKTFEGLKHGTKVFDKEDKMVMEIYIWEDEMHLASEKTLWLTIFFHPENFELYEGELKPGEYVKMKKYLKVNELTDEEEILEIENIEEYFKQHDYKVVDSSSFAYWVCDLKSLIGTTYSFTEI